MSESAGAVVVGVLAFVVVWVCVAGFIGYLNGLERAADCSAHVRQGPPSWDASTGPSLNVWDRCP